MNAKIAAMTAAVTSIRLVEGEGDQPESPSEPPRPGTRARLRILPAASIATPPPIRPNPIASLSARRPRPPRYHCFGDPGKRPSVYPASRDDPPIRCRVYRVKALLEVTSLG